MPAPAGTGLTRRSLSLRTLGLGLAVYGGRSLAGAEAAEAAINDAAAQHKVLVSVFIDGGLDSLSTLVPLGSSRVHEARLRALRPRLASSVAEGSLTPFDADPSLAWHPAASALKALWDGSDVNIGVAPAVGTSVPNYSHFTSRHFWEVGALDASAASGWMGRYLDRVGRPDVPIQGVSVGGALSPVLATQKVPVAAVTGIQTSPYSYPGAVGRVVDSMQRELTAMASKVSGDYNHDLARLVMGSSFRAATSVSTAMPTAASSAPYPTESSDFVSGLRNVARLLGTQSSGAYLPIRCVALRGHGTYDTHSNQEPLFSTNLRITTQAIKAFWADLKARGQDDRVVMLVWSEFGRRPQENGSAGCDHGAAGTAFVLGKSVKQGLIGEFPGLKAYGTTGAGLMQDGNLRATSDFRGIYSALLEQWMGTDAEGIIPGAGLKPGSGAFARPVLF